MAAPIITFHEVSGTDLSEQQYGVVDSGSSTSALQFDIWNAKAAGGTSTASNVTITTKTVGGLDSGDTIPNGEEIVTGQWLKVTEVNANGVASDAPYSTEAGVGGTTTKALHDIPTDGYVRVSAKLDIPATATAGTAHFKIQVSYQYV